MYSEKEKKIRHSADTQGRGTGREGKGKGKKDQSSPAVRSVPARLRSFALLSPRSGGF